MIKKGYGFTIVELFIVVVVIAILAAISIVAYRGIQERADASSAQSLATQAATKVKLYFVEHESYPDSLAAAGIADTQGLQYSFNNSTSPRTFCITATSANKSYYLNNTTVTAPTEGGCAGHGQGGVAAITNLAQDPAATGSVPLLWGQRWSWLPAYITAASDGPSGLGTYVRHTAPSTSSCVRCGFDHMGNTDQAVPNNQNKSWPVAAGVPVTLSVWVRASMSHPSLTSAFRVHNGSGGWVTGQYFAEDRSYTANTWVRLVSVYTPSQAGFLSAGTHFRTTATWPAGSTIDLTGMMVTTGSSSGVYADGGSPSWIWNGAQHSSSSTGPAL